MIRLFLILLGVAFSNCVCAQHSDSIATATAPGTYVEQMPEFPGGTKSLMKFLNENLAYPEEARKNGIEGKVVSQFMVNEDGSLTDLKIVKGLGYGCDTEVLRLINLMPPWNPALQNGKSVKVIYTLPVVFKLGD